MYEEYGGSGFSTNRSWLVEYVNYFDEVINTTSTYGHFDAYQDPNNPESLIIRSLTSDFE